MTDLLDRLRAANPVPACDLPDADLLWRTLSAEEDTALASAPAALPTPPMPTRGRRSPTRSHRTRAARLALGLTPLGAAAGIFALLVTLGGAGAPSVAARAYAATTPTGAIDHYVEISRAQPAPGNPPFGYTDSRSEVWFSGARSHVLSIDHLVSAGGHRSVHHAEQAIDGRRAVSYVSPNTIFASILPAAGDIPLRACETVLVCEFEPVDPIATLRELYRAGRLHDAGRVVRDGRSLDVLVGDERATTGANRGAGTDVRILVDPHTFVPVEVVATSYGTLGTQTTVHRLVTETTTIADYQRIPLTPQTSRLLAMRAHPGAHTICATGRPPAPHVAAVLAGC